MNKLIIQLAEHFHKHNFKFIEIGYDSYRFDEVLELLDAEHKKTYFDEVYKIQQSEQQKENKGNFKKIRCVAGNLLINS